MFCFTVLQAFPTHRLLVHQEFPKSWKGDLSSNMLHTCSCFRVVNPAGPAPMTHTRGAMAHSVFRWAQGRQLDVCSVGESESKNKTSLGQKTRTISVSTCLYSVSLTICLIFPWRKAWSFLGVGFKVGLKTDDQLYRVLFFNGLFKSVWLCVPCSFQPCSHGHQAKSPVEKKGAKLGSQHPTRPNPSSLHGQLVWWAFQTISHLAESG